MFDNEKNVNCDLMQEKLWIQKSLICVYCVFEFAMILVRIKQIVFKIILFLINNLYEFKCKLRLLFLWFFKFWPVLTYLIAGQVLFIYFTNSMLLIKSDPIAVKR